MNTLHRTTATLALLTIGLIPPTGAAPAEPRAASVEAPVHTSTTPTETDDLPETEYFPGTDNIPETYSTLAQGLLILA